MISWEWAFVYFCLQNNIWWTKQKQDHQSYRQDNTIKFTLLLAAKAKSAETIFASTEYASTWQNWVSYYMLSYCPYTLNTCYTLYFQVHYDDNQDCSAGGINWCYSVTSHEASDILSDILEERGVLIPSRKSASNT